MLRCYPKGVPHPRFESSETAGRTKTSEALREELLAKLIDRMILGPHQQIHDLNPGTLPMRELPPGNVSSLYLMYLGYSRSVNCEPASRSTFYNVFKEWSPCLRFRHASEHAMCVQCQTLKAAFRNAAESFQQIELKTVDAWHGIIYDFMLTVMLSH